MSNGCRCNLPGFPTGNRTSLPSIGGIGVGIRSQSKMLIQPGCCGDGVVSRCEATRYGCCPDGTTTKRDLYGTNCPQPPLIGGCAGTRYGCCPDGTTPKRDARGSNCQKQLIGGCAGTRYGCCPNSDTAKADSEGSNCQTPVIGGCAGTRYGCCADGITTRENYLGSNCPGFCPQCRKPRRIEGTNCYVICPIGEDINTDELEKRLARAVAGMAEIKQL